MSPFKAHWGMSSNKYNIFIIFVYYLFYNCFTLFLYSFSLPFSPYTDLNNGIRMNLYKEILFFNWQHEPSLRVLPEGKRVWQSERFASHAGEFWHCYFCWFSAVDDCPILPDVVLRWALTVSRMDYSPRWFQTSFFPSSFLLMSRPVDLFASDRYHNNRIFF